MFVHESCVHLTPTEKMKEHKSWVRVKACEKCRQTCRCAGKQRLRHKQEKYPSFTPIPKEEFEQSFNPTSPAKPACDIPKHYSPPKPHVAK